MDSLLILTWHVINMPAARRGAALQQAALKGPLQPAAVIGGDMEMTRGTSLKPPESQ